MMYPANFRKFPTFSMCSNQLVINQPTKNKQNGSKWRPTETDNSRCIDDFSI